jgi:hypothetical protein
MNFKNDPYQIKNFALCSLTFLHCLLSHFSSLFVSHDSLSITMQKESYNFSEMLHQVDSTVSFIERLIDQPGDFETQLPEVLKRLMSYGIKFIAPRRKPVRNRIYDSDMFPTPPDSPRQSSASDEPDSSLPSSSSSSSSSDSADLLSSLSSSSSSDSDIAALSAILGGASSGSDAAGGLEASSPDNEAEDSNSEQPELAPSESECGVYCFFNALHNELLNSQ